MRTRVSALRRPAHHPAGKRRGETARHNRTAQCEAPPRLRSSPVHRAHRRASRRRHRRRHVRARRRATSAASTSRWRAAISLSAHSCLPMFSSGASASREPADEFGGSAKFGVGKTDARIGRVQIGPPCCGGIFRAAPRKLRAREQARALPERGRGPRRIARSSAATARSLSRAPSRNSGCLSKREQRHRRKPAERRVGGEPGEYTGRRVGERVAAGILRGDVPARRARPRRGGPARDPASPAPRSCPSSTASRSATAMASASSSALAASIMVMRADRRFGVRRESRHRRRASATCRSPPPGARLPTRSRSRPRGAARLSTASRAMPMRVSSACMANCGWPGAGAMFFFVVAGDQPPRLFVEIGVEAGQHDGAVRQPRDRRDQLGGRRDRAGRTRGDHRRVGLAREPRRSRP